MKQHILEHWIKLAQEIQEGIGKEFERLCYTEDNTLIHEIAECVSDVNSLYAQLNAIKQHYSDLNT